MIKRPLGQERLTAFFENAVANGTLGHAYIIEGEEGSGKRTLAAYFSALAVCQRGNACGSCSQCLQAESGANPDITVISAEGKASIGVDAVRNMIAGVGYRAVHGGRKVFVIEDAELLTVQAQNALLKVIEEPTGNALFLLLCRQRSQMLRTITSRTQTLKVLPLSDEVLRGIVPGCSEFQLSYCGGNPGKLIKICADEEFKEFREGAVASLVRLFTGSEESLYETFDFFEQNKERKEDLFTITLYVLRDVMCKKMKLSKFMINADKIKEIEEISSVMTAYSCMKATEVVLQAEKGMGKYGNYNLAVQTMLIRCRNSIRRK